MILLFIVLLISFIKCQTAEGLVNHTHMVFGEIGQNVTIHNSMKQISNDYLYVSWYRLRPSGKVEHLAYFSAQARKYGRYSGDLSKGTEKTSLTISGATVKDSGRLFVVVGSVGILTPGSSSFLVIIDPKAPPVMHVFHGHTGTVLCELKGGGPQWSDPQWEIDDAEAGPKLVKLEAETFIDEHGAFMRSSIFYLEDGIRGLNCVCQHSAGVSIRTRIIKPSPGQGQGQGQGQCQLPLYLSPLAAALLLVTVTACGLWARRQRKQNPITQGMER